MQVLYLTNIPAPYRVEFFNQLATEINLTVVYEGHSDGMRNGAWLSREKLQHNAVFLDDVVGKRDLLQLRAIQQMISEKKYDLVVVGCYNTRLGALAISWLKQSGQRYLVNIDGMFFPGTGVKKRLRDRLVAGADGYLIAGDNSSENLIAVVKSAPVFPYRFSSLTRERIEINANVAKTAKRESFVLCVGQYEDYKGVDVLLEVSKSIPERAFVLVGSGRRASELCAAAGDCSNVAVLDFLDEGSLGELYLRCAALVLPSRQECWGLVINEALSYGATVVSTWGSGAAVEFLGAHAPERLAAPGDAASLEKALRNVLDCTPERRHALDRHLREHAAEYSIEAMVEDHMQAFSHFGVVHGYV